MRNLPAILLLAVLAACTVPDEQAHFRSVGPDGWLYADTVEMAVVPADSADTVVTGDVAVAVRHTDSYEYSNIWVEVSLPWPDSVERDTFDIRLADPYGRWLGTGVGVGYQRVDTLLRGVKMRASAPLRVRHVMRADTLADIEQVGLIFVPSKGRKPQK